MKASLEDSLTAMAAMRDRGMLSDDELARYFDALKQGQTIHRPSSSFTPITEH